MKDAKPIEKARYDLQVLLPDVPDERDAYVGRGGVQLCTDAASSRRDGGGS